MSALARAHIKLGKYSGRLGKSSVRKLPCCLDASSYGTHPELASHARTHDNTSSIIKPVSRRGKKNLDVRPQKVGGKKSAFQ